jgi:hypothetical protein
MAQMEQRNSSALQDRRAARRPGATSGGEGGGSRSGMAEMRRPATSGVTCVDAAAVAWCELARHRAAATRAERTAVSSATTTRRAHLRRGGRGAISGVTRYRFSRPQPRARLASIDDGAASLPALRA